MKTFRLPDLGEGLQEAELVEWRIAAGDEVAVDQPLLAVETAKAVVEIPSPQAGRIERMFAKAGDMIRVGAPLVTFEGEKDDDAGTVVGAVETGGGVLSDGHFTVGRGGSAIRATPAVRALARKLNVDLSIVTPSGAEGGKMQEKNK
jgi:pyruvate dehydrogenase E2 component (dihydrolipoamide acetyltransferase)